MLGAVTAPVAFVAAFFLTPLWRWVEETTGIESIGHSGPANWCFFATWIALLSAVSGIWLWIRTRPKH